MSRIAAVLLAFATIAVAGVLIVRVGHAGAHPQPMRRATRPAPSLRTAGPFLVGEIDDKIHGRWGRAWHKLYPAHQDVAPLRVFVRCETETPLPAQLQSIRVVALHHSLVSVPGRRSPLPGAAVTVRVELAWYGPRDPITFDSTFHLVPLNGRWRWLLSAGRYAFYRHDGCGTGAPSL
jgi:hypothetical protein